MTNVRSALFFLTVIFLLSFPVFRSLDAQIDTIPIDYLLSGITALGWLSIIVLVLSLSRAMPVILPLTIFLVSILFLRFLHLGIVTFSGKGFDSDFFLHFEWRSIQLAFQEYTLITLVGLVATAAVLFLSLKAFRVISIPKKSTAIAIGSLGLLVVATSLHKTPEGQFLKEAYAWFNPRIVTIDEKTLKKWQEFPYVNTDLIRKNELVASQPSQPKNVIVVYLESIGSSLLTQKIYPDLTPTLTALLNRYNAVEHYYSAGYVTIEGIVNSQCGTLFPFERGSDALASSEGIAENLVCLGDVLKKAGYKQTYMGGAELAFAKKGDFLAAHGFDITLGQEKWVERGIYPNKNQFGVSDEKLFELSLEQLEYLQSSNSPWNLTLLTIGTHIPGYRYDSCLPYPNNEFPLVQALHCTDQLIGRWIDQLKEKGYLDNTILVITADHQMFSTEETRKQLGGENVSDRRLPFIIISGDESITLSDSGASYDFAPTLLELLGITHNNHFLLGRSLTNTIDRDYFFARYSDIYQNKNHAIQKCEETSYLDKPLTVPLSHCDRKELSDLLSQLARSMSNNFAQLTCEKNSLLRVIHNSALDFSLSINLGEQNLSESFVRGGRRMLSHSDGLYFINFDKDGVVLDRIYLHPDEFNKRLKESTSSAITMIIQKDADGEFIFPIDNAINLDEKTLLWISKNTNGKHKFLSLAEQASTNNSWTMTPDFCKGLITQ